MKRFFYLLVLFLIISNQAYAQEQINSFFGISLGQSKNAVYQTLSSKYKIETKQDGNLSVSEIDFAGQHFTFLYLIFKNGVLVEGDFQYSNSTTTGDYETVRRHIAKGRDQNVEMANRIIPVYNQKYGRSKYSSDSSVTWVSSNGNSVEISVKEVNDNVRGSLYIGMSMLRIEYRLGSIINDI